MEAGWCGVCSTVGTGVGALVVAAVAATRPVARVADAVEGGRAVRAARAWLPVLAGPRQCARGDDGGAASGVLQGGGHDAASQDHVPGIGWARVGRSTSVRDLSVDPGVRRRIRAEAARPLGEPRCRVPAMTPRSPRAALALLLLAAACDSSSSAARATAASSSHPIPTAASAVAAAPPSASPSPSSSLSTIPTPASTRDASGAVSIVQSRAPSLAAYAQAYFFDTTYANASDRDLCTHASTSVPTCNVRTCPTPMPTPAGSRTTRPVAGVIDASVGPVKLKLRPVHGTYAGQVPLTPLKGGEIIHFEAPGDPTGVPAFSGDVTAPVFVNLTTPKGPGQPKLAAGAPFDLAWSPVTPDGVVRVKLVGGITSQVDVTCEFDGKAGKGVIPADAMAHLAPGTVVFTVDAVSTTVAHAGAFEVKMEATNSVVSSTAVLSAK